MRHFSCVVSARNYSLWQGMFAGLETLGGNELQAFLPARSPPFPLQSAELRLREIPSNIQFKSEVMKGLVLKAETVVFPKGEEREHE